MSSATTSRIALDALFSQNSTLHTAHTLTAAWIDTPLGVMIAVADNHALHLLEFDCKNRLMAEVSRLQDAHGPIVLGQNAPIAMIREELQLYYAGKLEEFRTPVVLQGTVFQQQTWRMLQTIPFGQTYSYAQLAKAIGKPSAYRAVAQANGANQLSIIVPCHRVINSDGGLGGYAGGLDNKRWLLAHEQSNA